MTAFNDSVGFVHIPKCAGHACRQYMLDHLKNVRHFDEFHPNAAHGGSFGHVALRDFETFCGRKPESFERIFAVIRDPYDHQFSQWCLPPDGVVILGDGTPAEIQDIQVGDEVISGSGVRRPVTQLWKREYSGAMVSCNVEGLPHKLRLTANHRLPVLDRGWITAGDLRDGDRVLSPRLQLDVGGSYEDGWLVGLYLADGWLTKGNNVAFCSHEDDVDALVGRLERWWPSRPSRDSENWRIGSGGPTVQELGHARASVVSATHPGLKQLIEEWVDTDARIGCGPGSASRAKRLRQLPAKREFARGVFDGWMAGDGCDTEFGRMGTTVSTDLAWQMYQLSSTLGHAASAHQFRKERAVGAYGPTGEVYTYWHVKASVPSLPINRDSYDAFAQAHQLFSTGAWSKAALARELGVSTFTMFKWLDWDGRRLRCQPWRTECDSWARRVTDVTHEHYEGTVHDITVDVDHTFLAGGVTVSNCYWKDMYARGFRGDQFEHAAMHPDLTHWLLDPMSDWHVHDKRTLEDGRERTVATTDQGYREFGGYYMYWLGIDGEIPNNVHFVNFEHLNEEFPMALREFAGGEVRAMERKNVGPQRRSKDPYEYYGRLAQDIVEAKFCWAFEHGHYQKWEQAA